MSIQKQTCTMNKKKSKKIQKRLDKNKNKVQNKKKEEEKKMKKRKIVNKVKFYKTMLSISLYVNFLLILTVMFKTGLLSKILDYIFIIY